MALLSRKVDYALLILSDLDRRPGGCARAVAERFGLSRPFIANILKALCQKGFVSSHRGVKGGYVVARPLEFVSLSDLMEGLDAPVRLAECNGGPGPEGCPLADECPVRGPVAEVHRRLCDVLRGVSVAELIRPCRATVEVMR
jgi:Rrf2 family transcriptional regulator, cysteine metabolism repressor